MLICFKCIKISYIISLLYALKFTYYLYYFQVASIIDLFWYVTKCSHAIPPPYSQNPPIWESSGEPLLKVGTRWLKSYYIPSIRNLEVQFSLNMGSNWWFYLLPIKINTFSIFIEHKQEMLFNDFLIFFSLSIGKKYFSIFFLLNSIWCWCSLKIELH